jgi:hypothetical protein
MYTDPPYSVCDGCDYRHAQQCLLEMQNSTADVRKIFDESMPKCDLSKVSFEQNNNCCFPDKPIANPFQKFFICMVRVGCNNTDLAKSVGLQQFANGCYNRKYISTDRESVLGVCVLGVFFIRDKFLLLK